MRRTAIRVTCVLYLTCCILGCDDVDRDPPSAPTGGRDGGSDAAGPADSGGAGDSAAGDAAADAGETFQIDRSGLADVGTEPLDYARRELWMCRPGSSPNPCREANLDATEIKADGSQAKVAHVRAQNPEFDCFYVYPTVLLTGAAQMTDLTDQGVEPVLDALLTQGARFSRVCEVYAPLYRQTGLSGGAPVQGADPALAAKDVRDAFAYYLEHLNKGRKFVLIGHSQGTFMLTAMMQMDLDNDASKRAKMISALLIGGRIYVPEGERTGGTFQNIPLCAEPGDTGCAIAYVSYAQESPPGANALFGGQMDGNASACTDPAPLAGNSGPYKGSYFSTVVRNASFGPDAPPPEVDTPFVLYRDTFEGECVTRDERTYLQYSLLADEERGTPPWRHSAVDALGFGTHLVDFHIALDDLIETVMRQAAALK
jgi:pimeloyl-ACP methyl ester carboxylesterase